MTKVKKRQRQLYFGILLIALVFGLKDQGICSQGRTKGPPAKPRSEGSLENLYIEMELFANAVSAVRSGYVDEVDSKRIVYGALKGMLSSLDDYSQFMEPEEYKAMKSVAKGEFGGIGIEINLKDGLLTVTAPISGSPADLAGVMAGDRIVKIDGKLTKKITLDDAVRELRGEPGTAVGLTLWREKEDRMLEISIKRSIIKTASVKKAVIVEEKIGYIKLIEFQEKTPRDLEEALVKLEKEGMDSLILDLRNNPGGLLDISVAVAEKFLPIDSPIVSTKSRLADQNLEFKSKAIFGRLNFPLVVMINEDSASASEVVAGAIQDNRRGIVLGKKSYGKGSVQTVMPLKDGSALKLTTASYFTPSGRSIRGEGIAPDVVVEREAFQEEPRTKKQYIFEKLEAKAGEKGRERPAEKPADEKAKELRDNQLEHAIDVIKGIKAYKKTR